MIVGLSAIQCKSNNEKDENYKAEANYTKADSLISRLEKAYPAYPSNDLILHKIDVAFALAIDSVALKNGFSEIPLNVLKISSNPYGKGAMVQFYAKPTTTIVEKPSGKLQFDYIAFMESSIAEKLHKDSQYFVSAKNIKRLNDEAAFALVPQLYFETEAKVKKDASDDYEFNAGTFFCEVETINPVTVPIN